MPKRWAVHSASGFCGKGKPSDVPWSMVTCGRCKKSDPNRRRVCQRGHNGPWTKRNNCRECIRIWHREERYRYAAAEAAYKAKQYQERRDEILARNRAWRQRNLERARAVERIKWYKRKANPTEADIALVAAIRARFPYRRPECAPTVSRWKKSETSGMLVGSMALVLERARQLSGRGNST